MDKNQHINYWVTTAAKDEDVMIYLMEGRKYVQALFFGHLYLEKIFKALWVKNNDLNIPPKTHNLLKRMTEAKINLTENFELFLLKLNQYQIEGRYPEDTEKLYSFTNKELAEEYIKKIIEIKICLLKKLH